jgi:uncharacterized membrane protein YuzA (DUF378 family)
MSTPSDSIPSATTPHRKNKSDIEYMDYVCYVAGILAAVGAINWLLVSQFKLNIVDTLLGAGSQPAELVYILVGLCGIITIYCHHKWFMKPEFGKKTN